MKKARLVCSILLVVVLFFSYTHPVLAHIPGQPPFFKVNGTYSPFYPVSSASLDTFTLPQDIAPDTYLINTSIQFEIDTTQLPVPKEIVQKTTFTWDYGDSEKATGLKNSHIYKKIGSYHLKVWADDGTMPEPQLLQDMLINILPDKKYQLPNAVVKVNGKSVKDPISDVLEFDLTKSLLFDGTSSVAPSSKIVSYFWDLGDGTSATTQTASHSYKNTVQIIYPLLRITDANGFISDSYVEIDSNTSSMKKDTQKENSPQATPAATNTNSSILLISGGVIFFILAALFAVLTLRKKK